MIGWFLYPIIVATVFIILYKLNNGFKDEKCSASAITTT